MMHNDFKMKTKAYNIYKEIKNKKIDLAVDHVPSH